MRIIIYFNNTEVNEFDNLEDAYSFTMDENMDCNIIEVCADGIYTVDQFQKWYSQGEF